MYSLNTFWIPAMRLVLLYLSTASLKDAVRVLTFVFLHDFHSFFFFWQKHFPPMIFGLVLNLIQLNFYLSGASGLLSISNAPNTLKFCTTLSKRSITCWYWSLNDSMGSPQFSRHFSPLSWTIKGNTSRFALGKIRCSCLQYTPIGGFCLIILWHPVSFFLFMWHSSKGLI